MKLIEWMMSVEACYEARAWVADQTPAQAWAECHRGEWMLWAAATAGVDGRLVVAAACACARLALPHTADPCVEWCIDTTERWVRGEASPDEVRAARAATDAAAYAARAAARAASATYAAAYAACAARAAAEAAYAYATADAAYATDAYATYAAVTNAAHAANAAAATIAAANADTYLVRAKARCAGAVRGIISAEVFVAAVIRSAEELMT